MKILLTAFFSLVFLNSPNLFAQSGELKGKVTGASNEPLSGATLRWMNSTIGAVSKSNGEFSIAMPDIAEKKLVVSFLGYATDTILVTSNEFLVLKLTEKSVTTDEVSVEAERGGTYISDAPIHTEVITKDELTKAACCDVAGCFEGNASVQAQTTNIITNSKELRILGLSGVYNLLLVDGVNLIQGLPYTYGISSVPGTLIENIFVSKGANTVQHGFENMTGIINVTLREPETAERIFANGYTNNFLEKHFNVNAAQPVGDWTTLFSFHTVQPAGRIDGDGDSFLDLPLLTRYMAYNKWKYGSDKFEGLSSVIGLQYLDEERVGGQRSFNPETDQGRTTNYGQTVNIQQPSLYTKTGFRFDETSSLMFVGSALYHKQNSYFGTAKYDARQTSFYGNLQYQQNWAETHEFTAGVSYRHFDLNEEIRFMEGDTSGNVVQEQMAARTYAGTFLKSERIPGGFAENVFKWKGDEIILITGIRADIHNTHGAFVTPRGLLKYQFDEATNVRLSAGTGYRTVNIFSENINLLASSRDVIFRETLLPERSLNWGINLMRTENWNDIAATFSLDFYRTDFSNQIFPDYDTDPTKVFIGNFKGTSASNGLQAEAGALFWGVFNLKLAYNYLDVYRIENDNRVTLPFIPKHKVLTTMSYQPEDGAWHLDGSVHWYGQQRLPNTASNPVEYRQPDVSQSYTTLNVQYTHVWEMVELYAGCENLTNFRQAFPITGWQQPFGAYFDTSFAWGPTRGREFYAGFRFKMD
jgi:outer membrane receptor for ferrienterochelin and colicin